MLSVIELLRLSLTIFRKNAGLYIGYSAWLLIPSAITFIAKTELPNFELPIEIVGQIILAILTIWIWIMLTLITAQIINKEKINTEQLSAKAWRLIAPVAAVGIIVALVEIIGFVLLIIPGIIFAVWYAFAKTDVILSQRRGLASMAASREMTRQRFWPVLWRIIAGPLSIAVIYVAISSAIIAMVEFVSTGTITLFSQTPSIVVSMLGLITDSLILPMFVIYLALLYLDLKQTLKEAKK